MKKTVFLSLLICVLITSAFSKNGYKDFKWGMTSEEVSKIALVPAIQKSLEEDTSPIFKKNTWGEDDKEYSIPYDDGGSLALVMYYLHGSELKGSILNPKIYAIDFVGYNNGRPSEYPGGYYNTNDGLEFFFSKNKLVGIVTYFNNDYPGKFSRIINELEEKYGEGFSIIYNSLYDEGKVEGKVWLDNNRYVVWSRSDNSSLRGMEFVTYLDVKWSEEICNICIQNYRKEKSQIRSRLD